jgi:hypothetical protein
MSEPSIPERVRTLPDEPAVIERLLGVLSEDQRKVKVTVELSNGQTHPDLELVLQSADGKEISRTTILENFGPRLSFTMHIRQADVKFPISLSCQLSYLDGQVYSEKTLTLEKA